MSDLSKPFAAFPKICPVCTRPAIGTILVCRECWFDADPSDRHTFRKKYRKDPQHEAAWHSIAEKIVRKLIEQRPPADDGRHDVNWHTLNRECAKEEI